MDRIFTTIARLFLARYGTQLHIKTQLDDVKNRPLFLSHWKNAFVYSCTHKQVTFPIFNSKKELLAIAIASPVENKDAVAFDEMSQFLQLTVGEHLELSQKKIIQQEQESWIQRNHDDTHKVISLKTRREWHPNIQWKKDTKKASQISHPKEPLWLDGNNENFNSHLAFSIHDMLSNWAFINAREIPDLIWKDPNHWESFPQVTLFIPQVSSLSAEKLSILKTNLIKLKSFDQQKPLIILSNTGPLTESAEQIKLLCQFYHVKQKLNASVQAHYLLSNYRGQKPWMVQENSTQQVYFLPFNKAPRQIH